MKFIGIDPGFSGAWGMITHNGKYNSCGDMHHTDKHIQTRMVIAEIRQAMDGDDAQFVLEAVHAMPGQGVSSTFKFGVAYGGAIAIAEHFKNPFSFISPREWKKDMGLNSDKDNSIMLAKELFPEAPLYLKKHNGRAEALLLAEWLRRNQ